MTWTTYSGSITPFPSPLKKGTWSRRAVPLPSIGGGRSGHGQSRNVSGIAEIGTSFCLFKPCVRGRRAEETVCPSRPVYHRPSTIDHRPKPKPPVCNISPPSCRISSEGKLDITQHPEPCGVTSGTPSHLARSGACRDGGGGWGPWKPERTNPSHAPELELGHGESRPARALRVAYQSVWLSPDSITQVGHDWTMSLLVEAPTGSFFPLVQEAVECGILWSR